MRVDIPIAFKANKISAILRADVPQAFRATKNLEDTMPPVNYRGLQRVFSEFQNPVNGGS